MKNKKKEVNVMQKTSLSKLEFLRRVLVLFLCIIVAFSFTACTDSIQKTEHKIKLYYINESGNGLVSVDYTIKADKDDTVNLVSEVLGKLKQSDDTSKKAPVDKDYTPSFQIKETDLSLYFTASYNSVTGTDELLSRSAVVNSLCQINGVQTVEFLVEQEPLTINGKVIGPMEPNSFVTSINDENVLKSQKAVLYFADVKGKKLVPVQTKISYSTAEPIAMLLLEKLIEGPDASALEKQPVLPTIPSNVEINRLTIRNNVCYLDLSKSFSVINTNVSSDVVIYSIVNTLCELPNVNKVQFSIDGEQDKTYGETGDFNTLFERNLDIVVKN